MKRLIIIAALMIMVLADASAEDDVSAILRKVDLNGFEEFASEHQVEFSVEDSIAFAAENSLPDLNNILHCLKGRLRDPVEKTISIAGGMVGPMLLLTLISLMLPGKESSGAAFICRISLYCESAHLISFVLAEAGNCLKIASKFSDTAAPVFAAVLTAGGLSGSSALIPQSAALLVNVIENLFLKYGVVLCKLSGCIALAANLSNSMNLNKLAVFLKKLLAWGTGLAVTVFSALIFLKGNAAAVTDNLALRTAKYAVDSASSIIGSGVSDVWDTYLCGLSAAKGVVGFSGAVVILAICIVPMLRIFAAMLLLGISSIALAMSGESLAARAFDELSGTCRMALTLCAGSMALWIILIGALLSLGRVF